MSYKYPAARPVLSIICLFIFFSCTAQTSYTDKIAEWKTTFPKEEVVANLYKEVIYFSLDPAAAAGEPKVKAKVSSEMVVKEKLSYTAEILLLVNPY